MTKHKSLSNIKLYDIWSELWIKYSSKNILHHDCVADLNTNIYKEMEARISFNKMILLYHVGKKQ